MIKNYPDGGLKMVDVESFNKALKVTWVKNAWKKTIGVSGIFFLLLFSSWKTWLRSFFQWQP